jgi:hypothetical protein
MVLKGEKEGWKVIHVPQAKIWHKGVQRITSLGLTSHITRPAINS